MENPDIAPNAARCRFRRIVVKVGSNVLTRADGTLDTDRMAAIWSASAAMRRWPTRSQPCTVPASRSSSCRRALSPQGAG